MRLLVKIICFGLRYIEQQFNIFGNIKFIVIIGNPDVYVSFKKLLNNLNFLNSLEF